MARVQADAQDFFVIAALVPSSMDRPFREVIRHGELLNKWPNLGAHLVPY